MNSLMGVIAVTLLPTVAMAGAGFDILGTDPIVTWPGEVIDVYIATTGGQCGGMSLALQVTAPFDIVALEGADFPGAYWTTTGVSPTASYKTAASFAHHGEVGPDGYAIIDVGSAAGNIVLPAGALMARVTIAVLPGWLMGGYGWLTTDADIQTSSLASMDGITRQDSVGLIIVPEPMTACLLLGCLPLIRRR
jgi:hypothetical protein